MGCRFLLHRIFPTQGLNPGLPHCRQTRYRVQHQGSLGVLGMEAKNKEPAPLGSLTLLGSLQFLPGGGGGVCSGALEAFSEAASVPYHPVPKGTSKESPVLWNSELLGRPYFSDDPHGFDSKSWFHGV